MEVKKLKFIEEFISKTPVDDSFRGIMGYCGDINILSINLCTYEDQQFFNINSEVLNNNNPKFHYFDIDEVKHAAQELFNEYVKQFIE